MVDSGRMRCRILHTSDLHLESLGAESSNNLKKLVDMAISTKADLVIVAGELFNEGNKADDNLVGFVVEQLQRLSVPTVILPGNHDCLLPDSAYQKVDIWRSATNVRILRAPQGETLALPGLGVSIWGKPVASYADSIRPLAGIPQPQGDGQWHVAVAHGYYVGTDLDSYFSLQITEEEIITSRQDYIALGHVPTFRCVCDEPVKAYYCGSPLISGTVAIVELVEGAEVQVTPHFL